MFTGIIEEKGIVIANEVKGAGKQLTIACKQRDFKPGESIAINGVCLTLLPEASNHLVFDLSPETLKLTNLSDLNPNQYVNLEHAMAASTRFGGHYVSGHVDTMKQIVQRQTFDNFIELTLGTFSKHELAYLIPKGSIAVDGVSLTINSVSNTYITLLLVPHTLEQTTLSVKKEGDLVNIEFDYLAKIIAHQINLHNTQHLADA